MAAANHIPVPERAWDTENQRWVYVEDLMEAAARAIETARLLYGEPEYTYFKKQVLWQPRSKTHVVSIGGQGEVSITREEYEQHATQAAINETKRFMGEFKQTYWRYERKQVSPAWREALLALIPRYPE